VVRRQGAGVALALILALGACLRLLYLNADFVDAHAWRQLDTAAMARNFYEGSFLPFDPRVDWGGRQGYLEAECPLIPALIALVYRIAGFHEILGRLVIIAFSLGLIWCTYRLALALDGRVPVARAAAFLMAISPAAVFFGRIVIPDTPMVFFTALALLGFIEFGRDGSERWLTIGAIALACACLLKLPAVFVGPAIVTALVRARGWRVFGDWRVWAAGLVPLAVTAAWYWHAHVVFERTGLTMGILGTQAKIYPAYVSPGPWPSEYSKWSTAALLWDFDFYQRMFMRFYHFLLLPIGFTGAIVGALVWRRGGGPVLAAWLLSMIAFVFIAGEVHRVHEYYQLPFVVMAAVTFGVVAGPLFDAEWLRIAVGKGRAGVVASAIVVTVVGLASFYASSVTQAYFAPRGGAERMRQAGRAIDAVAADNDLAIVVDDYGIMSPILLYFAHVKGWSFDPADVRPDVIDNLRRLGARYFVSTRWSEVKKTRPDAAAFLERYREVPLAGAPTDTLMFDLRP
jgi:4-amino-4-deoxy-L-arabinose transferase-like glycosyltransferase